MIDALILAASAPEQASRQGADGRHEIVVTGERIPRTQHETASSVAVVDASMIEAQAAPDRIEQLLQAVPNVQLGSGGEGPTIRGQDSTGVVRDLPAFLSGTRPRTTIRVDGRSATYYELAFGLTSIWDAGRVEVFRSPQTTTQGRNSIGGAIFVETSDPAFGWEGKARLLADHHSTRQVAGVVSGPLVDQQIAFRLSGDLRRSRTASRITSAAQDIDPNRDDSELVRFKLLARPAALSDTQFSLAYAHGRSQMPQIEGVEPPFEERRNPNAGYGIFRITVDSLTGRMAYQPDWGFEARATLSYGRARVRRFAPPGLGEARIRARDFSVEPIVAWRDGSGISLTGGLHYTRATQDQTIDLTTFPPVLGTGAFRDVQNSLGLFAESSFPLASALVLTAGLRRQWDRQDRRGALEGARLVLPLDYRKSFSAWLPKASLAWDVTPDLRLGTLVQRAYNPGGLNLDTARVRVETFQAERLWDFELFARARLDEDRLTLSANAFEYRMRNAQRPQSIEITQPGGTTNVVSMISNAPRAWTRGLELELDWRPSQRLNLRGAIGLLDTRITETLTASDPILDKQFQRSPHFSGSAGLEWKPLGGLTLSAQVRSNSAYFSDDRETAARRVAGSFTADAKAAWTWRGLSLFAYARNLGDEFHLTYRVSSLLATAGDPRELGVGIDARF